MGDNTPFAIGTEFASFSDFEKSLNLYEKKEFCVYSVSSSKLLHADENVNSEICEKLKYKYVRYQCLFYGTPREKKAANENDENRENDSDIENALDSDGNEQNEHRVQKLTKRRQSKSYRQKCTSYFTVRHNEQDGTHKLSIVAMNEIHDHARSETLFKSLPKQRRQTIKEAEPYLKHVMGVKPNLQLVQADITNTSENHGIVKRQDLYNFKNRQLNTLMGEDDLSKMINEMQKVVGSTVKVFHNEENELEAVYFQDIYMKNWFKTFPELLMFDGTFSLNDRRMPLIILLIVDRNGESKIVGLFLAKSENINAFNFLFEHFKLENPEWERTEVILTDKGAANLSVVANQFPNAAHHLCIFHVGQTFNREITTQKRKITVQEREICLYILNQMIYARSEERYKELYELLENTECEGKFIYL